MNLPTSSILIVKISQGFVVNAALGGPLVGIDERFHGMIVDLCHDGFEDRKCAKFLSLKSLYERLELFQILKVCLWQFQYL